MSRLTRFATLAVAASLVAVTAPASAAPANDAGRWLDRQVTNGVVHNDAYDFDDIGLTIDTGYALKALGGHQREVRAIRAGVGRNLAAYTTGDGSEVYVGATAKALVWATISGANPRKYAGLNLVTQLNRQTRADGRISDKSQYGDYANVVGQAYAARGLSKARSWKRNAAVDFLLEQQCSEGYFRIDFTKDPDAADQSCDGGDKATISAPDTDATALAVLQLKGVPNRDARTNRAIKRAVNWLARTQKPSGAFGGGTTTAAPNGNSTGLGAWVLGTNNRCAKAKSAARWVLRLQARGDLSGTKLRTERGAIAYNATARNDGRRDGITTAVQDQWRRTTAQAGPGLRFLNGCR